MINKNKNTIRVCSHCFSETIGYPMGTSQDDYDDVDYCTDCEHVVEGNTLEVTEEQLQHMMYDRDWEY